MTEAKKKAGGRVKHLWEIDHPYYCNQGNYFSNDCGNEFKSWQEFFDEDGDCDPEYNLLFRWDWNDTKKDGAKDFNGDVNYRNGELLLFWMGQRKGLYRYTTVQVCRADEPAVRKWLESRYVHLKALWEPLK